MALLTSLALLFLVVALAVSLALVGLRALRAWRSFGSFSSAVASAVDDVLGRAAAVEEHAASVTAGAARLTAATERLQGSLAELSLLQDAAGEARATVARVTGVLPRK